MSALSLDQYNLIKSFLIPCSKNFGMHKINPAKFSNVPGFSFSSQEKVKEAVEKVEDFMALYDVVSKHHSAFIAKDGLYLVNCPAACNIAAINIQSDKKPMKTASKAVHRYIGKSPATLTISSTGEFVKASTVPFVYKKGTSQVIVASITDGDKRTTIHRHVIKNKSVLVAPKTRFVFDIDIADSVTPEDVKQYVKTCKADDAKLPYIQLLLRKMPLKEYTTGSVDPYLKRWNVSVMGTHQMTMFLYLFSFNLYSKDDQREFLIQSAYSGETAINRFCQFLRNTYPEFVQNKLAEDDE